MSLAKRFLLVGLILFIGGPVVGCSVTVLGMVSAFSTLGQKGVTNPNQLAGSVGTMLIATKIGLLVSILGLGFLAGAAAFFFAERKKRLQQEKAKLPSN